MEHVFPLRWELPDGVVLIVTIGRPEEAEEVGEFIRVHFWGKPPNLQLTGRPDKKESEDMKQLWLHRRQDLLKQSVSLIVRENSPSGGIVAVWMNEMEEPPNENVEEMLPDRPIDAVLNELYIDVPNLFSYYETNRVFHIISVTVREDFCSRGIATQLNKLSLQLAVQNGAGAAKAEVVNEYAFHSFAKLGFEVLKSVDYATFEFKGTTPFACEQDMLAEHPAARLMARRLSASDQFSARDGP